MPAKVIHFSFILYKSPCSFPRLRSFLNNAKEIKRHLLGSTCFEYVWWVVSVSLVMNWGARISIFFAADSSVQSLYVQNRRQLPFDWSRETQRFHCWVEFSRFAFLRKTTNKTSLHESAKWYIAFSVYAFFIVWSAAVRKTNSRQGCK